MPSKAGLSEQTPAKNTSGENRDIIRSVAQALRTFDYLDTCGDAGVIQVAEALGVHKSTASRLLATMKNAGYVARDDANGKYSLGIRFVELANTKLNQFDVRTSARPFLEELARETGETVHLAIMEQDTLVYIDKVDTPHTLAMRSKIGYRISPHCTALGKAILSVLPEDKTKLILTPKGLTRFTPNTITDPLMFQEHLRQVKSRGFAVDDEEHEEGVRCAAAVILNHRGEVAGAISASGPTTRVSRQRMEENGYLVRDICLRLSRSLGYKD